MCVDMDALEGLGGGWVEGKGWVGGSVMWYGWSVVGWGRGGWEGMDRGG